MAKCPHANVQFCPLYLAAHMGGSLGCDDGRIEDPHGSCGVARGVSYQRNVELLRVRHPGLVEQCEWREMKDAFQQKKLRPH